MARGPAYPYINLAEAIRLVRLLYDFSKRASANLNSVLKDKWEYSPTSSSAVKIVAALKYYGLIETGAGAAPDQETIRITDRAFRILIDNEESPERKKAIQDACLAPKAYKLCWDTWGKEMPESMRSMLIFTHGFHEGTVDGFLVNYRKSVDFAGLLVAEEGVKHDSEQKTDKKMAPSLGDFVQWEHDGVLGLPSPLKLVRFSDDKSHAWVEGHATGLPYKELVKAAPPQVGSAPISPEAQVEMGQLAAESRALPLKRTGMRQETLSLNEGEVIVQWPEQLSAESLADFNDWLKIWKRRIERDAKPPEGVAMQPDTPSN